MLDRPARQITLFDTEVDAAEERSTSQVCFEQLLRKEGGPLLDRTYALFEWRHNLAFNLVSSSTVDGQTTAESGVRVCAALRVITQNLLNGVRGDTILSWDEVSSVSERQQERLSDTCAELVDEDPLCGQSPADSKTDIDENEVASFQQLETPQAPQLIACPAMARILCRGSCALWCFMAFAEFAVIVVGEAWYVTSQQHSQMEMYD
jgi:hypothetical protein